MRVGQHHRDGELRGRQAAGQVPAEQPDGEDRLTRGQRPGHPPPEQRRRISRAALRPECRRPPGNAEIAGAQDVTRREDVTCDDDRRRWGSRGTVPGPERRRRGKRDAHRREREPDAEVDAREPTESHPATLWARCGGCGALRRGCGQPQSGGLTNRRQPMGGPVQADAAAFDDPDDAVEDDDVEDDPDDDEPEDEPFDPDGPDDPDDFAAADVESDLALSDFALSAFVPPSFASFLPDDSARLSVR